MKIKESFAASSDPLTSHRPFHGRQTRPRQARRLSKSRGAEILDMKREVMRVNQLTQAIIGAAIEVHRTLGPGLLERAYKTCLCRELQLQQLSFERQKSLPVTYKGLTLSVSYQLDMVVAQAVVVEIKAVSRLHPIHNAQLLTYLKMGNYQVGLLLNFNVPFLREGIRRKVLDFEE